MNKSKGLMLASAAAALFASGASLAVEHEKAGTEAKVHCSGVNACKGTSECKTATTSCKSTNSCKGTGWLSMTQAECDAQKGTVVQ